MSDSSPLKGYPLNGNAGVLAISKIEFVGDFVPHSWYRFIKNAKGRSDPPAVMVLARLVACYMPFQVDPVSWHASPGRKPVRGEFYRIEFEDISEYLRFSPRQVRKALGLLQSHGLLQLHLKGSRLYVEMEWEQIISISYSTDGEVI